MNSRKLSTSISSLDQQKTIENLNKDSKIGYSTLPDRMESSRQPAGVFTLEAFTSKARALLPLFLLQSGKNGASNLNIQEDDSVRMMMRLAKYHSGWVTRNIGRFRIQNQQKLAEIALKCAERAPREVVYGIKNFDIKDPAVRGDIALKCLESIPSNDLLPGFTGLPAPLMLDIKGRDIAITTWAIAQCIESFDIKTEAVRIEIARKYAKKSPDALIQHFKNFAITCSCPL